MNAIRQKLTLDSMTAYQIKVPGEIDARWANWYADMRIDVDYEAGLPVTTLSITTDQAGLHSLLRRLYSFGLPLLSVVSVDASYIIDE